MSEVPAFMWREAGIASFECPTKILFGVGAHEQLADLVREHASKRLLMLLDPALVDSAIHRNVASILSQCDVATVVFSVIDVQAAFDLSRERQAEGIVAVGGDSTIEVAKSVDLLISSLPLISIPTTAGTRAAVSAEGAVAILDPLAVSSMPAHDAAYAGIDAFVHAFESYLSKRATVFSDAMNLQAMTLIAASVRAFVADRNNASAALDVLCGSAMAAMSFGATGLGNVNCMATAVSSLFPVPHGLANAVCLPHAAAFNAPATPERYARIAAILGIDGSSRREAKGGTQAIHGLRALCSDLGIPPRLRDVGVDKDQLDELARLSFASDHSSCNPRLTSEQDFRELFRSAY